tara:strand:+ start:3184 stop:3495 length:312 start_codon:yes stop_codon:yes gene_type:complete
MRNSIKRHKVKFTHLYQLAMENDISFAQMRSLSLTKHQLKRDKRLANYLYWPDSVFDGFMLMVSVRTNRSDYEVGLKIYLSKAEIPHAFQHLWTESTNNAEFC